MRSSWRTRKEQFERIVVPHLRVLYGVARQLVGAEKADDLIQETFLRAWKYFESFDPATNCRAWLFRILRNEWVNSWHKERLSLPVASVEEVQFEPYYDWEDDFLDTELSADMEQALAQLPADYRFAVLLADVEEFSYQEMARIMECPIGTVMSRLNRGRRMLARLLRTASEAEKERPVQGNTKERQRN